MPKKSVKAEVNTFVRGLITEAGPLNFPPNASLDELNFELLKDGSRQRRLGFDLEPVAGTLVLSKTPNEISTTPITNYVWENVGGDGGLSILAVQIGTQVYFYNLDKQNIGAEGYMGFVDFPYSFSAGKTHSFASVEGLLIVANGSYEIYSVSYDKTTNTFSKESFSLKVRDFWGVEDPLVNSDPYTRTSSDSQSRRYNLYNQSWGIPRRWEGAGEKLVTDPVDYYFAWSGKYPSNAETVWTAMTTKAAADPYEYMRPNAWGEVIGSMPVASKGFFVIDLLRRGASRQSAIENNKARFPEITMSTFVPNEDITPGGASIVAEFAGRAFYAGFSGEVVNGNSTSPILSNYVVFSNVVRSKRDLSKCYQEGDPTSREGSDVIDTDGGYVRISGAKKIVGLMGLGSAIIIFADNGVWSLTGGNDYGFSATNYKVTQLSNFGCVSTKSIVKANDSLVYWGFNGIYTVGFDSTGQIVVNSITDDTIHSLYASLTSDEKENSFGVYDDVSKTIRWMYAPSFAFGDQSEAYEMVLDTRLKSFYQHKIKNPSDKIIRGMFKLPSSTLLSTDNLVISDTNSVLSNTSDVVIPFESRQPTASGVKYLVFIGSVNVQMGFAYYCNQSFLDWNAIDAQAYLLTGAVVAGDSSVKKQVPYVTVHMYRTEDGVDSEMTPTNQSSCFMRGQWEWSNSPSSNKWGQAQQVYRYRRGFIVDSVGSEYDSGFELISTKSKLRGMGRAVSLYFYTEAQKDCRIVGWNINLNGNSVT